MSEDCANECGRPHTVNSEFCLPCWQKVPMQQQKALSVAAWRLSIEPESAEATYAYQAALDRAIKVLMW